MLSNATKEVKDYLAGVLEDERVIKLMSFLKEDHDRLVDEQCGIALVEAPPLFERKRAEQMARKFADLGLTDVCVDDALNVTAKLQGSLGFGEVLAEAHLDTVFPFETVKKVTRGADRIEAPGISDNCRGLAAILGIVRGLKYAGIVLKKDVTFAGTSGEEGIGDLKGMRNLFMRNPARFDFCLSIDGHGSGHFVFDGTGSRRYSVTFETQGGHSWTDFGASSAVHAMGRAIAKITDIVVPDDPRTSYNVGIVSGGTSVNAIAQKAEMLVDLRSVSNEELDKLEAKFMSAVTSACSEEKARSSRKTDVRVCFRKVGDRPAGRQKENSPAKPLAMASSELLGIKYGDDGPSSTNTNIPVYFGVPSLCMGAGGEGGGIHTVEEWFAPADGWRAVQQAALILIATAGLSQV